MPDPGRDYEKAFGERLKMVIRERGMTQKVTAEKAGITEESMSAYCRGKRGPDFRSLVRIAEALGISPALLFCPYRKSFDTASLCWTDGSKGDEDNA